MLLIDVFSIRSTFESKIRNGDVELSEYAKFMLEFVIETYGALRIDTHSKCGYQFDIDILSSVALATLVTINGHVQFV